MIRKHPKQVKPASGRTRPAPDGLSRSLADSIKVPDAPPLVEKGGHSRSANNRPLTDFELRMLFLYCERHAGIYALLRRLMLFGAWPPPPPFI